MIKMGLLEDKNLVQMPKRWIKVNGKKKSNPEYINEYRKQNPEITKKWRKKYRVNNTEKIREYRKEHYQKNIIKIKERHREYYQKNRERILKKQLEYAKEQWKTNPIYREKQRMKVRKYNKKLKLEILTHYSNGVPICVCCNEMEISFLSIDHINNDGNEHRQKLGKAGTNFYIWLKKNNYPKGFQVLCMNCQFGKKCNNGVCPHQNEVN